MITLLIIMSLQQNAPRVDVVEYSTPEACEVAKSTIEATNKDVVENYSKAMYSPRPLLSLSCTPKG
ncbi:MAG: hypothetical protein [Bacteriophage sp.]|nr:MAG: hypothetical protein [Bacteriophage sp.]